MKAKKKPFLHTVCNLTMPNANTKQDKSATLAQLLEPILGLFYANLLIFECESRPKNVLV